MNIYIGNISDFSLDFLINNSTPSRIKYSDRFKYEDDSKRSLLAGILLNYGIYMYTDCRRKYDIEYDEYSCPFVSDLPDRDYQFSISHSDSYVVCCIDSASCGIDIEKIKPGCLQIAQRFFADEEKSLILSDNDFYIYWTLKECLMKSTGLGMKLPTDSFYIENKADGYYRYVRKHDFSEELMQKTRLINDYVGINLEAPSGYCMSACGVNVTAVNIIKVSPEDICD